MLWDWWRFRRYKVQDKPVTEREICQLCEAVSKYYKSLNLSNPFVVYESLIDYLASHKHIHVSRLENLLKSENKITTVALRHDMDGDVITGIRAARYLARKGIPGSFYILHSSHYYGSLEGGIFFRNKGMEEIIRRFVATGCELGVHSDPMYFYREGINGAKALRAEIEWIRSKGGVIRGTVAHNSAALYGAENFEIFKGRSAGSRKWFNMQGVRVPLQVLSEHRLGLSYEGNFPLPSVRLDDASVEQYVYLSRGDAVRKKEWLEMYFLNNPYFNKQYDIDIWLLGRDAWVIAVRGEEQYIRWPVSTKKIFEFLDSLDGGLRVVISVHPEYVSLGSYFSV